MINSTPGNYTLEPLSVFTHDLKQLLAQAVPDLKDANATGQLLLHQFLAGIPESVSRPIRASGEVQDLDKAVERARLLMTVNEAHNAAAVVPDSQPASVTSKLEEQVAKLTEQVAALAARPTHNSGQAQDSARQRQRPRFIRCFRCNRMGHTQHECSYQYQSFAGNQRCFTCGRMGHIARDCYTQGNRFAQGGSYQQQQQGNDRGMPGWGDQVSQAIGPHDINVITPVAAVNTKAAVMVGKVGGVKTEMLLDSGSSVSLMQAGSILESASVTKLRPTSRLKLVTASGEKLRVVDHVSAPVQVGTVQTNHNFVVVNRLVAPVILGVDFLQRNCLVLDFSQTQVEVRNSPHISQKREPTDVDTREEWEKIYGAVLQEKARVCAIATVDPADDIVDECCIPRFGDTESFEYPHKTAP